MPRLPRGMRICFFILAIFLSLELILQVTGFFLQLEIKNQNLSKGGNFNILCFGDSFTYGLGAPREGAYPSQLELILNNAYPQKHIKVVNLGVPGYNSSQCLKSLREKFDFYNPKIVIVMSGMNNCWNFIDSSYFQIKQFKYNNPLNFKAKLIDAILCKLKTYKFVKIAFINIIDKFRPNKLRNYQEHPLPMNGFQEPLRSNELAELLREGLKYFEEGKYDLSETIHRKGLELSPGDYEPHWFMGRYHIQKGEKEKAREELILAARYAPHPYIVMGILADMQDQSWPINSSYFKEYINLIKDLRSHWVKKFGEEYVQRYIDSIISYKESDLEKILVYDLTEIANYVTQRKAKLVVLTYPWPPTKFRCTKDIYQRISNYLGMPLVDNTSLFVTYLKTYRYQELFVADGHCTTKGYRLIAENIAEVLKKYNLL